MNETFKEDSRLNERQNAHLKELAEMLEAGGCRLKVSDDATKVLFYGRSGTLLCSCPASEYDY